MTYRDPPSLRVIKTTVSALPEPIRAALISSTPDTDSVPLAIALGARLRPGPFMVGGLLAIGWAVTCATVASFTSDNASLSLILGAVGAALFVYGLVNAVRSMTVRIQFRAVLLAPTWIACTEVIGDRVDLVPLALVERVVPSVTGLYIVLRDSRGVLHYPLTFDPKHTKFSDAVHAAIPHAAAPDGPPLDDDIAPFSRGPSIVAAVVAALALGIPVALGAVAWRAKTTYEVMARAIEQELATDATPAEPVLSQIRVRVLGHYMEQVTVSEEIGGLPWFLTQRLTDVSSRRLRYQQMLDEARAVVASFATSRHDAAIDSRERVPSRR